MDSDTENLPIWPSFCAALGTEYRESQEITGASGLTHAVEAIGVDDKHKRVVLISSEYNPRIAALMRVDVQASMPDVRVLVARPLAIDLAHVARTFFFTEGGSLNVGKLMELGVALQQGEKAEAALTEHFGKPASALLMSMGRSALPIRSHIVNAVEQASALDWSKVTPPTGSDFLQSAVDILTQFSAIDNLAGDRHHGICPLPTYEFSEDDWDLFVSQRNVDDVRHRLKELSIYQYFYPPADRLALGLIDSGSNLPDQISAGFELAQNQGHTIDANELVPDAKELLELLDGLKSRGYTLDGEFGSELTEQGRADRRTLSVRPREGLITQISRILSIKADISLRDILGPR